MATLAITIDIPPTGELETSGDGSAPTDAQMAEESLARQEFLYLVSPFLKALPDRPLHRAGNVSHLELFGRGVWSQLNHYLLLVTVDIGGSNIAQELSALLPSGSQVSAAGDFESLAEWPEQKPA